MFTHRMLLNPCRGLSYNYDKHKQLGKWAYIIMKRIERMTLPGINKCFTATTTQSNTHSMKYGASNVNLLYSCKQHSR